jgi:hypothetical protein
VCVAGKYATTTGNNQALNCIDCGAGQYSAASSDELSDCIGCAVGTYSAAVAIGVGDCIDCGAGKHSALGSDAIGLSAYRRVFRPPDFFFG